MFWVLKTCKKAQKFRACGASVLYNACSVIGLEYFWMSDFFGVSKKIIYIIFILGVRKKIIYIIFIFSGGALGSQKKIIYIIFILRKKYIYIIFFT